MATFRFTAGPWNIHEGNETFGPGHRKTVGIEEKMKRFAEIGMSGMQFHDDDAVPDLSLNKKQTIEYAKDVRATLEKYGLFAEFVAPRLWFTKETNDGAFTASNKEDREYAWWRAERSCDIAEALGTHKIQLWLAREGTLCAESKSPVEGTLWLRDAFNHILEYDREALILVEPKPNEPVDRSYCGTAGHALTVGANTIDPSRVGLCIESAHSILSGLDPACDMGFALAFNKLWGVHLNDQNGMKYTRTRPSAWTTCVRPSTRSRCSMRTTSVTRVTSSASASTSRPCGPSPTRTATVTSSTPSASSSCCWRRSRNSITSIRPSA